MTEKKRTETASIVGMSSLASQTHLKQEKSLTSVRLPEFIRMSIASKEITDLPEHTEIEQELEEHKQLEVSPAKLHSSKQREYAKREQPLNGEDLEMRDDVNAWQINQENQRKQLNIVAVSPRYVGDEENDGLYEDMYGDRDEHNEPQLHTMHSTPRHGEPPVVHSVEASKADRKRSEGRTKSKSRVERLVSASSDLSSLLSTNDTTK